MNTELDARVPTTCLDARIALVLGWTQLRPNAFRHGGALLGYPPGKPLSSVPRWSSDLNLMYQLQEKLSDYEWVQYINLLMADLKDGSAIDEYRNLVEATAEQKARAWLKAMEGK